MERAVERFKTCNSMSLNALAVCFDLFSGVATIRHQMRGTYQRLTNVCYGGAS